MGGEEHLRSARTVRSAQAASWPMVKAFHMVHLLALAFVADLTWMGSRKELWDMCRARTEIILQVGSYHRR